MKLAIVALALFLLVVRCLPAEPISAAVHGAIMVIADREGVPRSVANWQQIEESGNWQTGAWGDAEAVSHEAVRGFHSRGLFQIFEEPKNLDYLLRTFWRPSDGVFDILDPIDNATLALRYLAALHRQLGTWFLACVFYNHGSIFGASAETLAYAARIINARAP